jgi:hypothetical protein
MSRKIMLLGSFLFLLSPGTAAPPPPARPAGDATASLESYRLLVTRNIFMRDRSRRVVSVPRTSYAAPPQRSSEDYVVLTGVAVREPVHVAFFEDSQAGRTIPVCIGQVLGRGVLTAITMDGIQYQSGGVTRMIGIGENLRGVTTAFYTPSAATQPAATTTPTTTPTTGPTTGPATQESTSQPGQTTPGGTGDILERLRLRRAQELGQ